MCRIGLRGFIVLRLGGFFNGLCRITDPAEMTILRDTNSTKRFHSGWDICVWSTKDMLYLEHRPCLKFLALIQVLKFGIKANTAESSNIFILDLRSWLDPAE